MNFWKKAGGVLLALALLIGLLPLSAAAAAVCEDGKHTPDLTTLYPANWNSVTGGYGDDYYKCTTCGADCTARGYTMQFVAAENGCSGGRKCHVRGAAFTTCSGTTGYYRCASCERIIDADGTLANISSLGGHTPDLNNPQLKNYTPCMGGYQSAYYLCTACSQACDASGNGVVYTEGTGVHDPDLTKLYPADWNSATGGYGYDYYKCKDCGSACHKDGKSAVFVGPDNGCSGGEKCHLPGAAQYPADFDVCNGGYQEPYYRCTHCDRAVDAQGTIIKRYEGAHTPGADLLNPDYIACVGGYQNSYYRCTVCDAPCNADGSTAEWIGPTAKHTPGGARHGADYSACGGGYQEEWYACTICDTPCDENGVDVKWYEPTAKHIPGSARHDANYTACGGGFRKDWYECTVCGQPVDENGNDAEFAEPTAKHTPGAEEHEGNYTSCTGDSVTWYEATTMHTIRGEKQNADYTPCGGGFPEDWYNCAGCGQAIDENCELVPYVEPTAPHTPGSKRHPADYTPCGGGCKSDYYICDVCHMYCNADGSTYDGWWAPEPDAAHIPGELQAADYTVCGGGYKTTYYLCGVCGQVIDPALEWFAMWYEPTDPHTLTKMDALAPTYEADGNVEYWHCTVCGANFYDAKGEKPVEDMDDLLLPKLESRLQTSIKPGLSAVPASVAAQYPTVSDIKQALVSAALTANTTLIGAEANSVLMDVTLQRQNPDGTLTPVSAEDFPAEGVEVLLPYPEGTDQTYTFVVTHMITAGAHAGEIEVLANTPEAGGIRVRFTSMSPVCITYQKPAAKPGTDDGKQPGADDAQKPAADTKKPGTTGKNQTGTTTTTTAVKTGDNANLALWGALLVLSALVLTCWLPKKKEQE